jgi:hypothetical protein
MTPAVLRVRAAVALTGSAALVAGAAGLPLLAAVVPLVLGATALGCTVTGRPGAGAVAPLAVLSLAACTLLPGARFGAAQALALAVALVAYFGALEVRDSVSRMPAVIREATGAFVVAAAIAALFLLPAATAVWLVPVGLGTVVIAFAVALSGAGSRP